MEHLLLLNSWSTFFFLINGAPFAFEFIERELLGEVLGKLLGALLGEVLGKFLGALLGEFLSKLLGGVLGDMLRRYA